MNLSEPTQKSTWQTPPPLLAEVRAAGVRVELDPATAPDNPTRAKYFFSPEAPRADVEGRWLGPDALAEPWPLVPLFSNPPWSKDDPIDPWIRALCRWLDETRARFKAHAPEATLVLPDALNTRWSHELLARQLRVFAPARRLAYVDPDTGESAAGCKFNSLVFARWSSTQRRAFRWPGRWV